MFNQTRKLFKTLFYFLKVTTCFVRFEYIRENCHTLWLKMMLANIYGHANENGRIEFNIPDEVNNAGIVMLIFNDLLLRFDWNFRVLHQVRFDCGKRLWKNLLSSTRTFRYKSRPTTHILLSSEFFSLYLRQD